MSLTTFLLDYLVNALWMAPLLFAAVWLLARLAARLGPQLEHRLWLACLALQLVLPACRVTPRDLLAFLQQLLPWHGTGNGDALGVTVSIGPATALTHLAIEPRVADGLLLVYLGALLILTARLAVGLRNTWRLRHWAIPVEHRLMEQSKDARLLWQAACAHFHVTGVPLLEANAVAGPVAIGLRSQAVLLPRGFADRVDADDLEAALMHECAHVHRRDYAKNLLYRAFALPLGWHPAVRASLARIAATREMLCDDLALAALTGRDDYAHALLRLAALMATAPRTTSHHAIGILDANSFERRVMRLTTAPLHVSRGLRMAIAALSLTAVTATCASALALRLEIATAATAAPEQGDAPKRVPSGVMAGNAVYQKRPVYPEEAKAKHIEGAVMLHAIITKEGNVEKLEAVSGPEELRASAIDAVKEWRYKPYLLNGEPTAVETTITVNYHVTK